MIFKKNHSGSDARNVITREDLGYPLNVEDYNYAHSKEYQVSLKKQEEHDENTNPDMFEGDIQLDEDAERMLQERGVVGLREVKFISF